MSKVNAENIFRKQEEVIKELTSVSQILLSEKERLQKEVEEYKEKLTNELTEKAKELELKLIEAENNNQPTAEFESALRTFSYVISRMRSAIALDYRRVKHENNHKSTTL